MLSIVGCAAALDLPDREDGDVVCVDGACACAEGRLDCDGEQENGCEVSSTDDPHHCGACNQDCLGGACVESVCQPLALGSNSKAPRSPWGIASRAGFVYVASDNGLVRASTDGSAFDVVVALPNSRSTPGLVMLGDTLYWAGAAVQATDVTTGETTAFPDSDGSYLVAASSQHVVYSDGSHIYFADTNGHSDGAPVKAKAEARGLAVGNGALALWTTADGIYTARAGDVAPVLAVKGYNPSAIVVFEGSVYFTSLNGGVYQSTSADGSSPAQLVDDSVETTAVAPLDKAHVFFGNRRGEISLISPDAPGKKVKLAHVPLGVNAMTTDGEALYWTTVTGIQKLALPIGLAQEKNP